ncbi:MAG: SDR family oxidoreductase [Pseudomonadota bacterium]
MTDAIHTALVTGGAHRIGRAIAVDLAAHGYNVVVHANHSADAASALAGELATLYGVRTGVVLGDLEDPEAVDGIVPAAVAAVGPLGVLVNNASLFIEDSAADLQSALWRRQMAVNAEAPARLIAAFALASAEDGNDRLAINLIDQRVLKPTPRHMSYSASKSTLWWLTRTMAQALAPKVRVNGLSPGPVLKSAAQEQSDFDTLAAMMPLQRTPQATEFGQAVRFFHQMPAITGQMLAIDGGQHLNWQTPDAVVPE